MGTDASGLRRNARWGRPLTVGIYTGVELGVRIALPMASHWHVAAALGTEWRAPAKKHLLWAWEGIAYQTYSRSYLNAEIAVWRAFPVPSAPRWHAYAGMGLQRQFREYFSPMIDWGSGSGWAFSYGVRPFGGVERSFERWRTYLEIGAYVELYEHYRKVVQPARVGALWTSLQPRLGIDYRPWKAR